MQREWVEISMSDIIIFDQIEEKILEFDGEKVILDSDVAELYGVETKRINEAVKNNIDRFPDGYVIELDKLQKNELVENFDRFNKLKHSTAKPKAFTEKGLYMLATILTSKQAIATTIAIVEAFQKIKNLSRVIKQLPEAKTKQEQQSLMQKSGEIIAEILDDALESDESETTIELNLAVLKFKHTIKKKKS